MKQANNFGFSLLELCICMTLMIIISGMGYAFYQHEHQEMARKNTELYLQDIALSLHEHEDSKTGYANLNLAQLGFSTQKDDYNYSLNTSNTSFLVTAQPQFEDPCGMLTIDQQGQLSRCS